MNSFRFRLLFGVAAWDFWVAVGSCISIFLLAPARIPVDMASAIFEVGIQVLSIIFSVFFAALAIIITSGDDIFIRYLQSNGVYQNLIWAFRATLLLLFLALLASIALFVTVQPFRGSPPTEAYFPHWGMALYGLLSIWSLLGSVAATLASIRYAEYRVRFLSNSGHNHKSE